MTQRYINGYKYKDRDDTETDNEADEDEEDKGSEGEKTEEDEESEAEESEEDEEDDGEAKMITCDFCNYQIVVKSTIYMCTADCGNVYCEACYISLVSSSPLGEIATTTTCQIEENMMVAVLSDSVEYRARVVSVDTVAKTVDVQFVREKKVYI